MSRLSEERLKEADHSRMRDESRFTLVPVDEELVMPPLVMPEPLPAGLNLRRYAPGIGIGLVIATAFLLGGAVLAPLWDEGENPPSLQRGGTRLSGASPPKKLPRDD